MNEKAPLSLAGHTLRFHFADGPTANKTYEHTFSRDGTVVFRDVSAATTGKSGEAGRAKPGEDADEKPGEAVGKNPGTRYASFDVGPGLHLVSYLSSAGYTLSVLVNTNDDSLHGFASNEREWYPMTGALQR